LIFAFSHTHIASFHHAFLIYNTSVLQLSSLSVSSVVLDEIDHRSGISSIFVIDLPIYLLMELHCK
jgi:hypothetical protein